MSVVVDVLDCACCANAVVSSDGMMNGSSFICYVCRKAYKVNKQNNWIDKVNEQQVLINANLEALKLLDVLDIAEVNNQLSQLQTNSNTLHSYVLN